MTGKSLIAQWLTMIFLGIHVNASHGCAELLCCDLFARCYDLDPSTVGLIVTRLHCLGKTTVYSISGGFLLRVLEYPAYLTLSLG